MVHVIIVLGCSRTAFKKQIDNNYTPYHHAYSRLVTALKTYQNLVDQNTIVITSGYQGQADKMKQFLVQKGVDKEKILREPYSNNTIENCIFSYELLNKWLEVNENEKGSKLNIHLVTNDYHMDRSEKIFRFFQQRLTFPITELTCHPADILEYAEDVVIEDLEEDFLKERDIIDNKLEKMLKQYNDWHPTGIEYSERLK